MFNTFATQDDINLLDTNSLVDSVLAEQTAMEELVFGSFKEKHNDFFIQKIFRI